MCSPEHKTIERIASVGEHEIFKKEFIDRYEKFLRSTGIKDNIVTRRSVINSMIDEVLLFYYDDNSDLFSSKVYKNDLKWSEKQTILAFLKDREVYAKITVSDEDLRSAFLKSNQKISARHLYSSTLEEANNLFQLLQTGVSFNSLAKQVFTDPTLRNNGGYLGFFSWGDMDKAFEDAVYSMKIGEVSQPIKTDQGYSIIKLEDRIQKPLITEYEFQKIKSQLTRAVQINKKYPQELEYIKNTVNFDEIVFNQNVLNNVYNKISNSNRLISTDISPSLAQKECVTYKEKVLTQNEIEKRLALVPTYHLKNITSIERLKTVIKGFILQDELLKIADQKGYNKTPEVIKTIKRAEINTFMKYKKIEITKYSSLSDSIIFNFYNENKNYFTTEEERNIQEIIVDNKELAEDLFVKLKNGANFGKLAKEYSIRSTSGKNNGEMGFTSLSQFGFLKDTFDKAKIGKIIAPIKFEGYWGIFKVLAKKESELRSFKDARYEAEIYAKYYAQKELYEDYVNNLKTKIAIKIDYDLLSSYKTRVNYEKTEI